MHEVNEGLYINSSGKHKQALYIVLELAKGGELFDFISNSGAFCEYEARYYFT